MAPDETASLVVLVVDADGAGSPLADACRTAGHHVMTATGIETALCVIGGVMPDMVLVRARDAAEDRDALAKLQASYPEVPSRLVEVPARFAYAADSPSQLN